MKRLALAVALACVLSGVARAGEMHPTGAVPSPTPGTKTTTGEMHPTGATVTGESHPTGATVPQEPSTVLTIILTLISIVS